MNFKLFEFLNSNGYAFGTDFIVGHLSETDELGNEAIINLNNLPLTHIHSFIYSKRDDTRNALIKDEIIGHILNKIYKLYESKSNK